MPKIILSATPWDDGSMEDYVWADKCLLNQPYTVKVFQPAWQAYRYLLSGKMYAFIGIDGRNKRPVLTLKLEPLFSDMLRSKYQDIVPGYYMNKLHWSTIYLDGIVPNEVLTDIIHDSYKLAYTSLSKKVQQELNISRSLD